MPLDLRSLTDSSNNERGVSICVLSKIPDEFAYASTTMATRGRRVSGTCSLPLGYTLSVLPFDAVVSYGRDVLPTEEEGSKLSWRELPSATWSFLRRVVPGEPPETAKIPEEDLPQISYSYSFSKAAVSLFQTLYASFTLYRTRGNQIDQFGYAAFGLTVAPYAVMSLVNLIGNLVTPDFPDMYLVGSEIMEEAVKRGGHFGNVVGYVHTNSKSRKDGRFTAFFRVDDDRDRAYIRKLEETLEDPTPSDLDTVSKTSANTAVAVNGDSMKIANEGLVHESLCEWRKHWISFQQHDTINILPNPDLKIEENKWSIVKGLALFISAYIVLPGIELGIVGGISRFRKGEYSTHAQRVWTMSWLSFGIASVQFSDIIRLLLEWRMTRLGNLRAGVALAVILALGSVSIGGFVVVGQELNAYGRCIQIY
jgi:hypothetical protein